jgi:hypothetical protein
LLIDACAETGRSATSPDELGNVLEGNTMSVMLVGALVALVVLVMALAGSLLARQALMAIIASLMGAVLLAIFIYHFW